MADLADVLFDADASAGEPLVHWRGQAWSWGEIGDAAERLAETLRRMGAAPDSAVAAVVPSSPLGLVVLFGIWRAGAVVAPLDPELSEPELERRVAAVKPSVVARPSLDEESLVPQVRVFPGVARRHGEGAALELIVPATEDAPERVLLAHDAVLASVDAAARRWRGAGAGSSTPAGPGRAVPMPHALVMPLARWAGIADMLVAVRLGAAVVLLHPFSTTGFADAVRTFELTSAALESPMVTMLVDDPGITSLAPLRHVRSVTAPVPAEVARRCRDRFGVLVLNTYGAPELGGEVVGWSGEDARHHGDAKLGSVGRPHEGFEVRVVLPDGTVAAVDEPGEIRVRAPFVARRDVAAGFGGAPRVDAQGYLCTGDLGRVDRDGFLWIEEDDAPAGPGSESTPD